MFAQPPLRSPSSITILGAGLMGRLLAVALARQGHKVEVHDAGARDGSSSAAHVAAAMLAPLAESIVAEPCLVRMGQYALQRWPELLAELAEPVYFQRNGTLIVWHRQDAPEAARLRQTFERTQGAVPQLPHMLQLDTAGLAEHEPALAGRFSQSLLLPGEGQLDGRQLLIALAATMEQLGVAVHWHSAKNVDDFAPGSSGQPDWLLDCRGVGAKAQWSAVRGVRGEVVRLHAPDVTLQRPTRLVHPRYSIYLAPKENHHFVIGATEIESDDLSPASVRSTLELLSAAYAVHPGFAEARITDLSTQCRPTLPDNLPALRCVRPRVLEVNGLYRHGYMIAPAILDACMQLLNQGQSALATDFELALHAGATATA